MQRQLLEGRVTFEAPRTGAMRQIIQTAHDLARTIYKQDWTVLEARGAEFVTSDSPVSMVDLTPEHPWSGNGWESSAGAVSFYPLSPTRGLFMTPGDCGLSTVHSGLEQTRRLNLMTYGWAAKLIFAARGETLTLLQEHARDHPTEVAQRKSPKQVVLFPSGEHNDHLAEEYERKGWPAVLPAVAPDGTPRMLQYVVLDIETIEPGEAARAVTRITDGFVRGSELAPHIPRDS